MRTEHEGASVMMRPGFSIDLQVQTYERIEFLYENAYAPRPFTSRLDEDGSFSYDSLHVSVPVELEESPFDGYRLMTFKGVEDYRLDVDCITTAYFWAGNRSDTLMVAGWKSHSHFGKDNADRPEDFFTDTLGRQAHRNRAPSGR